MRKTTKIKHKINATSPRLSDEDLDPLEQDDPPAEANAWMSDGWLLWDPEDIADIKKLIGDKMATKQKFIIESFLDGLNYSDVGVTEKYWRYHFSRGIEFIKKELKL
jgi:hypothetical protein